jgi:hypothetical protein
MALAVLLDEALAPSTSTPEAAPAPAPAAAGRKGRRPSSERVASLSKPNDISPFDFASPGDLQVGAGHANVSMQVFWRPLHCLQC